MDLKSIKTIGLSLLTGIVVGLLFSKLSLPVPAPPNFEAFAGVAGVCIGSLIMETIEKRREK